MSLPKAYIAKNYESDIYSKWEENGAFKPRRGKGEPFSIVLPPPNATGTLHLGHAVMLAIEDTLVRYARMQDRETLWVPGTDHAAIATENVVIGKLKKEGMANPRTELGREGLLEKIHEFVEESQDTIRKQIRTMGASVDWSRERYTLEPAMNHVVSQVFIKMYKDGLIYRGNRIVNWDPNLQTTVSDDEVVYREEQAPLYTLQYGPFQISTARPETKFGDKYVVMHPDDRRYKQYEHKQQIEVDWINGKIKATIIKDEAIDPDFGTGVMTITPWHDKTDFEIAERHKLDFQQIIDQKGNLLDIAGELKGQSITEVRPKIIQVLKTKKLLVNIDDGYRHNIALNDRGKGVIEPQVMEQWFIDVNKEVVKWKGKKRSLKQVMKEVVEGGDVQIIPGRFDKVYYNWIDNLHDWCISRQIWWGHRIPAWYKQPADTGEKEVHVGEEAPKGEGWTQDPDTLDTWFSSATWTWSTLLDKDMAEKGASLDKLLKKSADYKRFHPTTVLETGYDILFFWVARMILMTTYVTGDIPFKHVYLHGMVRTRDGVKMSKSDPETTIDPLEIIPEYGADALRLSMLIGQTPGSDNRLYKEKIAGYRNFCNKLWNVGRYITETVPQSDMNGKVEVRTPADGWIFNRVQAAITEVGSQLDNYHISQAGQEIYQLLWDDFADWYIEASKSELNGPLLVSLYRKILQLAHPLAPYVTEVLWEQVGGRGLLMNSSWPKPQKLASDQLVNDFKELINIVSEIRELKADLQLAESNLYYNESPFLDKNGDLIVSLTGIKGVKPVADGYGIHLTKTSVNCWIDVEENLTRNYLFKLIRKRDEQKDLADNLSAKLDNKDYTSKAPKELVEETKSKLKETQLYIKRLGIQIENLEHVINLYQ